MIFTVPTIITDIDWKRQKQCRWLDSPDKEMPFWKKKKRWQHLYLNFLTSNWLSLALSLSHTFWVNINNIFWMAKLEAKNLRWTVPKKLSSSEKLTVQIKYLWKISLPGMKNIEIIYLEKNGNTSQSLFLHLVKSTICRNCEGGVRLKPFK